jgi:hypothetical protein
MFSTLGVFMSRFPSGTGLVAALLVSAPLAACGVLPPTSPVAHCIEQLKVECAFRYQCCTDIEDRTRFQDGRFSSIIITSTNESECVENATHVCQALAHLSDVSVERGRSSFDAERAARCLDQRRDALGSCDMETFGEVSDDCREVQAGLGREGDPCLASGECADDGVCDVETDSDGLPRRVDEEFALPEGECQERADEGDDCSERVCRDDLFCSGDLRCEEFARVGDSCFFGECANDLFCNEFDECERDTSLDDDEEDFDYCRG